MKHPTIPRVMVLCLSVLMAPEATAQKSGRDRVLKIDAVALIDHGQEIEGKLDFQQRQGRYNYLFANADSLRQFQGDPARYEIQLGGACGRMGALSGEGSPKLFSVHDGRLYIFASEQCKRSFLAGPEKVLLRDEQQPVTTEAALRRGRELLERAVNAVGGAAQLDSLTSYREQLSRTARITPSPTRSRCVRRMPLVPTTAGTNNAGRRSLVAPRGGPPIRAVASHLFPRSTPSSGAVPDATR